MFCVSFIKQILIGSVILCINDYSKIRKDIINNENSRRLGSNIELNALELIANNKLMSIKLKEWYTDFDNQPKYIAGQHFIRVRHAIERSEMLKIIKKMPKGGNIHCHDDGLLLEDHVLNLIESSDYENLYACVLPIGRLKFRYHVPNDESIQKDCEWKLLKELRNDNSSFDNYLKTQITLHTEPFHKVYYNPFAIGKNALDTVGTIRSLIFYEKTLENYLLDVFQIHYDDNIRYMEIRSTLLDVYDSFGRHLEPVEILGIYDKAIEKFKETHPDFIGAKVIYTPVLLYYDASKTPQEHVESIKVVHQNYPHLLAGYDLSAPGYDTIKFMPYYQQLKGINRFVHDAEGNWPFTVADVNLLDFPIAPVKRFGHGFSLVKHPKLLDIIKENNIPIDVQPISTQIVGVVPNLSNHPLTLLMALNYSVCIGSDTPGLWGAKGLSYDWYYAFMAMAGREADLKFLKQLAINSIQYSTLRQVEKIKFFEQWRKDWEKFIYWLIVRE